MSDNQTPDLLTQTDEKEYEDTTSASIKSETMTLVPETILKSPLDNSVSKSTVMGTEEINNKTVLSSPRPHPSQSPHHPSHTPFPAGSRPHVLPKPSPQLPTLLIPNSPPVLQGYYRVPASTVLLHNSNLLYPPPFHPPTTFTTARHFLSRPIE